MSIDPWRSALERLLALSSRDGFVPARGVLPRSFASESRIAAAGDASLALVLGRSRYRNRGEGAILDGLVRPSLDGHLRLLLDALSAVSGGVFRRAVASADALRSLSQLLFAFQVSGEAFPSGAATPLRIVLQGLSRSVGRAGASRSLEASLGLLLCFQAFKLTGEREFDDLGARSFLLALLASQGRSGWFEQVGPPDPVTQLRIAANLCRYHAEARDVRLQMPLRGLLQSLAPFVHPRGFVLAGTGGGVRLPVRLPFAQVSPELVEAHRLLARWRAPTSEGWNPESDAALATGMADGPFLAQVADAWAAEGLTRVAGLPPPPAPPDAGAPADLAVETFAAGVSGSFRIWVAALPGGAVTIETPLGYLHTLGGYVARIGNARFVTRADELVRPLIGFGEARELSIGVPFQPTDPGSAAPSLRDRLFFRRRAPLRTLFVDRQVILLQTERVEIVDQIRASEDVLPLEVEIHEASPTPPPFGSASPLEVELLGPAPGATAPYRMTSRTLTVRTTITREGGRLALERGHDA